MATCVPVKDLRNTSSFLDLVENSTTPITVTKNGYDKFVAIKSADFQELQEQAALGKLMARILVAEDERTSKQFIDGQTSLASLRKKYEI